MRVNLIAAMDAERGIGLNNELPWHCPEDLQRFFAYTNGRILIAGSKTVDSLIERKKLPTDQSWSSEEQPLLPGRALIVLSRKDYVRDYLRFGLYVARDLEHAFQLCDAVRENWSRAQGVALLNPVVIGGAQLYAEVLEKDLVDEMVITQFPETYQCDTYFPEWNPLDWQSIFHAQESKFDINVLKRKVIKDEPA